MFFISLASADFGIWKRESYCNTNQYLIAQQFSTDRAYNELNCQKFCNDGMQAIYQYNPPYANSYDNYNGGYYDSGNSTYYNGGSSYNGGVVYEDDVTQYENESIKNMYCCSYMNMNRGDTECRLYEGHMVSKQNMVENRFDTFSAFTFNLGEVEAAQTMAASILALATIMI